MQTHNLDYKIYGNDLQVVEVGLDPNETVIAEAGAMNWLEEGISFKARLGDGSQKNQNILRKLVRVGKRALAGESIFMTHFTNAGAGKQRVAFAAPIPGKIIPIDMSQAGGELLCQKNSFLCAALGTEVSIALTRRLGAGLFGGGGFVLQRLRGSGMVFVHAGGTVVEKELHNESLRIDTGCLMAFTPGLDYNIKRVKGLRSMFFGGEGVFLTSLKGSGKVYLQSMPFSRLADRISQSARSRRWLFR